MLRGFLVNRRKMTKREMAVQFSGKIQFRIVWMATMTAFMYATA